MKNYEAEVRECWGNTDAYREYTKRTKNYAKEMWSEVNDGLMAVFAEFAECKNKGLNADSSEAQSLVSKLREYITSNYYNCTDEILSGLGKMYISDDRFKNNIDKYGEGTAEFVSKAIGCN